ncbi:hypothetical protein NDU88_004074 [Pleurodeles waltl]|uniref:Reverse transcriptase domain-containing protein n=1 Tax=Pleurodeles waltl TaxID=8319 RepID=A0AAV7NL80_PLEWA|nr:hypothetical protein NDU88_004074 [Pleurodeles waltl]
MNSSLLRRDVQEELRRTYIEWQGMKDTLHSTGEWWECVKGRIQDFLKNMVRKAARGRRKEFSILQQQLQELHRFQIQGWDIMHPLEEVKKELNEQFHDKSRRIIFRSKVENLEKGRNATPSSLGKYREGIVCDTKEDIRKVVTDFYGDLYSEKRSGEDQARKSYSPNACIRKNLIIRRILIPGDAKKKVKCALYMDDITLFCTDGKSIQSLLMACKVFGKASGAKINVDKSQAKLFGHWDLCNKPLPFPSDAGLVKILGVWFGGPGAAAKGWNEHLAKVEQKLEFWSLRHLSIEVKALVLKNDTLPLLQYVTRAWSLRASVAWASTPGIGAGRHRSLWTPKTPRQPKKPPLRGGTERRQNRNCQKPWKVTADPGELNKGAATLQEKRGLSRYGVRGKGNRAGGGRNPIFSGGAGRHRSSWTPKTLRQPKKPPLRGGTERCRNRNRQKPWKTTADPGELNEGAATLQDKCGLSRYGVRDKRNRAGGGRYGEGQERDNKKGTARGTLRGGENKRGGHNTGSTGKKRRQTGEREGEKNSKESYIRICEQRTDQKGKQENNKKGRKGQ